MNENENNFEALRQLMALKRHEIPPPGYFEGFAGQVNARIRAGEAAKQGGVAKRFAAEAPWLFKFFSIFEAKPAFLGGFASALCLLLLFGIVFAERPDTMPAGSQFFTTTTASAPQANTQSAGASDTASSQSSGQTQLALNTNSSLQPVGSSAFGSQNAFFQSASYTPPALGN